MFGRDAVRMAKRRWPVIVLFHGVGGAGVIGSGRFGLVPLTESRDGLDAVRLRLRPRCSRC